MPGGATLLVLYKRPTDTAAFDSYYQSRHAPLAKQMPGLQSFTIGKSLENNDPYYLVATLTFASLRDLKSALTSPEGEAATGDLKNFAQAGADIMMFESAPA